MRLRTSGMIPPLSRAWLAAVLRLLFARFPCCPAHLCFCDVNTRADRYPPCFDALRSPDDDDEETGAMSPSTVQRRAFSSPQTAGASQARTAVPMSAFAVLATTFTMTFVAEWGDRSQIATIAMGAAKDPLGVCVGGLIGHALCTGLAVLGGKLLATRISERAVLIVGGVLFLVFAAHSLWAGPDA